MDNLELSTDERDLITRLYRAIVSDSSTIPELVNLKRELHTLLEKSPARVWETDEHKVGIYKVLTKIEQETDSKKLVELIRVTGSMFYHFSAPIDFVSKTKEMILKNLIHPSGHVRDAARRAIGSWRLHDSFINGYNISVETEGFIKKLVAYIQIHQPKDLNFSVEEMVPSVYKTLLLAYDEIVRGLYVETWVAQNPEFNIDFPQKEYVPVIDRTTLLPLLWKRHQCETSTLVQSQELSDNARGRLKNSLEVAGFSTQEAGQFCNRLKSATILTDETQLVSDIVVKAQHKNLNPNKLGSVIRELQATSNHQPRLHQNINFTQVLLAALTTITREQLPRQSDWNKWMNYIYSVHTAIDAFYQRCTQAYINEIAVYNERLAQIHPENFDFPKFDTTHFINVMEECRSIAHHTWDWIIQTQPNVIQKTPEKFAAICYSIVQEINVDYSDSYTYIPYNIAQLAKFGGWKSQSSVRPSVLTYLRFIQEVVPEPTLFLLTGEGPDRDDSDLFQTSITSPAGTVAKGYMRYFVVITSIATINEAAYARFKYACLNEAKSGTCLIESIKNMSAYTLLTIGIDYDTSLQSIIDNIIISANSTDPFLRFHFLAVNTHKPTETEITDYLSTFPKNK